METTRTHTLLCNVQVRSNVLIIASDVHRFQRNNVLIIAFEVQSFFKRTLLILELLRVYSP